MSGGFQGGSFSARYHGPMSVVIAPRIATPSAPAAAVAIGFQREPRVAAPALPLDTGHAEQVGHVLDEDAHVRHRALARTSSLFM